MYCSMCGQKASPQNRFCGNCGAALPLPSPPLRPLAPQVQAAKPTRNVWAALLTVCGIVTMVLSLPTPWAAGRNTYGVANEALGVTFASVLIAAFVAGNRASSTRPRFLTALLAAPIVALLSTALPIPYDTNIQAGGVLAIISAVLFIAAMIADIAVGTREDPPRPPQTGGPLTQPPASLPVRDAFVPTRPAPPPPPPSLAPDRPAGPPVQPHLPTHLPSATPPRVVTRSTPSDGKRLIDDFEDRGERTWSTEEISRLLRLYTSGLDVEDIAEAMHLDRKDIAARLSRDLLGATGESLVDPTARRFQQGYEQWEYAVMARWGVDLPFSAIVRELERDQLGVGWRMLNRGIPRRG